MENTILLVDDEEGIRKVLGISLADMGYAVHTAENGEEALRVFAKIHPPIVLTDIKMPGMDGIELLKTLKQDNPDTEVIMITGHGDIELAIKSLKFEATDFVTKPINDDVLEIALRRARERICMRRKLKEYTENLERLVEEKTNKLIDAERMAAIGETVAGLSHTIKNIASGLKGGTFVLEKGIELDDKTYLTQGWQMVKGNVDKIKNLSLNLLNYAKSAELHYEICDPNQPAKEVAELMIPAAKEHSIALKTEFDKNLKPMRFDPENIHLCLLNLLTNAMDACKDDSGGKHREVLIRTTASENGGVEYCISDNGCGMDEDIRAKIFQSFFTTKGTGGTGIGLMLTKKIVDAHKGQISVRSEQDKGSEFIIRLS
ncbi:MAG TPA: hybrid sensor histidine kinase/response regulator [Desulfobacteraceae bacterium]|nr:hybrid sensor histidine kinase/response regulator [Desulfobacteraceae bacterium]